MIYAGGAISWRSQRQAVVATSTTEAEVIAASEAAKEVIWFCRLIQGIVNLREIPTLQVDNRAAVKLSHNPEYHRRTKHIEIKHFFVHEKVLEGKLNVKQVSTEKQTRGWDLHKLECEYIMNAERKPCASIRLVSLILLKVKKYGLEKPFEEVLGRKMSFGTLMSHSKNVIKDKKSCQLMRMIRGEISHYIGPAIVADPEEFVETYGKILINGFRIMDDNDSECVGCGVYLG
ncbi:retrovirus-related Pol polyprotein from transposon TNT 1-94 [Trichonephila clavipes]|nr:retrovirus-related Pol polyprotein from transposon TNT 1-94 [Trichonephila clavipes]